jgi:predicted amidohydrolase
MGEGWGKEEMVSHALEMMDRCAGSDLIILPELWNIGFFAYEKYIGDSEPIDGYTASAIGSKARELGAWVCSGSFVESRGGKYYNTSVLFDRKGRMAASYSKIHLFSYKSRESELLTPGNEIVTADTEFGKIGLSICYDMRFPELYRKMTEKGAEIFLVASAWPFPRYEAWDFFNKARAAENVCYLISCNSSGKRNGALSLGHSRVVDPWGTVIADSDHRETIVKAEIDPGLVGKVRGMFPVLTDRVIF